MQILIVEDELPAAERLQVLLNKYDPSVKVVAVLQSIVEAVSYLETHVHPDLMLLDISLSDGCSFEIFRRISFQKPVIFTTAYDHFAVEAFSVFSIDFILKPVTLESLGRALEKYKSIVSRFVPFDYEAGMNILTRAADSNRKTRFLAKIGQKLVFVQAQCIVFFEADNKIVYLHDIEGGRYVIDYKLEKLEELLDSKQFFRVNRSYLVNISAIQHIKPYFNNRLKICLKGSVLKDDLIVSRDRVGEFKAWADG